MKTASFPSLRVDPKLRQSAETVLREGESLSSFVEHAIRTTIDHRQVQQEFIARGLASRDKALKTGVYVTADAVVAKLQNMLEKAKSKRRK